MKRTVLVSMLVVALIAGLVGAATWAYFSDVETSSDNTFTAGTLDLTPDSPGAFVSGLTNLAPNVNNPAQSIVVTNSGTLAGATMDIDINVTGEADGANPTAPDGTGVNMTAAALAAEIVVDTLTWDPDPAGGAIDLLALITDTDASGAKELDEVDAQTPTVLDGLAGLGAAGADDDGTFTIDVTLDPDGGAGNDPQGDGLTFEVVFTLNQ